MRDNYRCTIVRDTQGKTITQHKHRFGITQWRKSPPGTVKINFDGSYSATERTAAIGILARDGTRLPLAGSANFISPATDASTVEAHACYHCYSFNIIFAIKNTFYVLN
ncbi:hypothetical protein V6N11_066032 [Hibiscus sabdariffa]|uniref:RNase H type-1 domain-containing protein n=1 Tax=Hibiscus sabdariffa TaxID=183260 RepID=A0ABR2NUG6_9ROSI